MADLPSITAVNASGWRARFTLAETDAHGPHISGRVIEIAERDGGPMATTAGQTVAHPLAPAVFRRALRDGDYALELLQNQARYSGYTPDTPSATENGK
jgi:hypothetical protein